MNKNKNAFTIVELLVVIVVIGILAAITIVSYSGISNKAIAAGLQNDLDSNSKILKMYNVEYGSYPNALDDENCPLSPEKDSKYCLKSMNGTTLQYSGGGQRFDLIDLHVSSGIVYKISENSAAVSYSSVTFSKNWTESVSDEGLDIELADDNSFVVAGSTSVYGAGSYDAFISKFDASGSLIWNRIWGETGYDRARSVTAASDGGYFVSGTTTSYGQGNNDIMVTKISKDGAILWNRTWGGGLNEYAKSITASNDGGLYIAGYTNSFGAGDDDALIMKISGEGNLIWKNIWGGSAKDRAYSVSQNFDGSIIVAGVTSSFSAVQADACALKISSDGVLQWDRKWGGSLNDYFYSATQLNDGDFVFGGYTTSYGSGNEDFLTVKIGSSGDLIWDYVSGGSGADIVRMLKNTSDGGLIATGSTTSFGAGTEDEFLAKLDNQGSIASFSTFGSAQTEISYSAIETLGGYTTVGYSADYKTYINKYSSGGVINNCNTTICKTYNIAKNSPSASFSDPSANLSIPSGTFSPQTFASQTQTPTINTFISN